MLVEPLGLWQVPMSQPLTTCTTSTFTWRVDGPQVPTEAMRYTGRAPTKLKRLI